jgi:hypothetical protein
VDALSTGIGTGKRAGVVRVREEDDDKGSKSLVLPLPLPLDLLRVVGESGRDDDEDASGTRTSLPPLEVAEVLLAQTRMSHNVRDRPGNVFS